MNSVVVICIVIVLSCCTKEKQTNVKIEQQEHFSIDRDTEKQEQLGLERKEGTAFFEFNMEDTLVYGENHGLFVFQDTLHDSILADNFNNYRAVFLSLDLYSMARKEHMIRKRDSFSTNTTKVNDFMPFSFRITVDSTYTTGYYKLNARVDDYIFLSSDKDTMIGRQIVQRHYFKRGKEVFVQMPE